MTELEKKTLKAQTDLVQSVLEAHEKKNSERVDMLITNAIKQLKMSRFKPDQATCISLTYLARTCPKIFTQSSAIKEVLKGLVRRDQGPANIKGKSDVVLPVLAANILLACCDTVDVRTIILNKIEQWISGNQKVTELVQHLLATLCMKCKSDELTVSTLIEHRQHWLVYLDENYEKYGPVPIDLSSSLKKLLDIESCCESVVLYLNFLIKHDTDIVNLSADVSRFILDRPLTLSSMLREDKFGVELGSTLIKIFNNLLDHVKSASLPVVKIESKEDVKLKLDSIYVKLASCQGPVCISKSTTQAIFTLLSSTELDEQLSIKSNLDSLRSSWMEQVGKINHIALMYEDASMTIAYNIPEDLRLKLIHSTDDHLVDLALRGANVATLLTLLQQFALPPSAINKILSNLEAVQDIESIRSEIRDKSYFTQLISFYSSLGCSHAGQLRERLQLPLPVS